MYPIFLDCRRCPARVAKSHCTHLYGGAFRIRIQRIDATAETHNLLSQQAGKLTATNDTNSGFCHE